MVNMSLSKLIEGFLITRQQRGIRGKHSRLAAYSCLIILICLEIAAALQRGKKYDK